MPPEEQTAVIAYILARRTKQGGSLTLDALAPRDAITLANTFYGGGKKRGTGYDDLDAFNDWAGAE